MKKTIIIAAAAALLFTSCEKKEQAPLHEASVSFVIDGPVTRVTTVDNVTSFEDNDVIAITSEGLAADITAAEYTVTGTGLTGESVTTYNGEKTASFLAHYPASVAYEDGSLTFTVPAAQTADNFHASMFMVAQATGSAASPVVSLKFKHQLAWVKVVLSNIAGVAVNLNGVLPTATWTKDALTASGEATSVSMWKQTDAQTYWALIPAQTIAAGTKLITIETDDKGYEFTLAENLAVSTAKIKTITLSVEADETVSASFTVDGTEDAEWTDEETGLVGNVTETAKPLVELISADQGDFTKVTALNANVTAKNTLAAGWGTIIAQTTIDTDTQEKINNATIEITDGAVTITGSGYGAWYNKTLAFLATNAVAGTYTLEFECKVGEYSDVDGNNDLQINVMQGGTTANIYYNINENSNAYLSCTTVYEKKTFKVVIPDEANLDPRAILLITPKTANTQTFYVRNVKFVESAE